MLREAAGVERWFREWCEEGLRLRGEDGSTGCSAMLRRAGVTPVAGWSSALLPFLLGTHSGMVHPHTVSGLPPLLRCYSLTAFNYLRTELEAASRTTGWHQKPEYGPSLGNTLFLEVWDSALPRVK